MSPPASSGVHFMVLLRKTMEKVCGSSRAKFGARMLETFESIVKIQKESKYESLVMGARGLTLDDPRASNSNIWTQNVDLRCVKWDNGVCTGHVIRSGWKIHYHIIKTEL